MAERRLAMVQGTALLVLLVVFPGPRPAAAMESPGVFAQRLLGALHAALATTPVRPDAVAGLVRGELVPRLDLEGIARRVTGPRWNALGPEQQGRLKLRVQERLERLAVAALEEHGGLVRRWVEGARVLPARHVGPDRLLLRLHNPRMAPDEIRLWLTPSTRGWRVAEVAAAGLSLAAMTQALTAPAFGAGGP